MKYVLSALLFSTVFTSAMRGQCSDAGACSLGTHDAEIPWSIAARYYYGYSGSTDDIRYNSLRIEGEFLLFSRSRISVLLPFSSSSGPAGSAGGIGDLTVLWRQLIRGERDEGFSIQAGGKFATGEVKGSNLPQAYQPGLGTNDILLGAGYEQASWLFALGYQFSRGRSANTLTRLSRGDDLFGKAAYRMNAGIAGLVFELIAIKRLRESTILDPGDDSGSRFIPVPGSDQFQVNIGGSGSVPLGDRFELRAAAAVPLLKREVNVDGLTRSLTLSLGLSFMPAG